MPNMSDALKSFARRPKEMSAPEVIVASAHMRELLQFAERAAESDAKVLITGESGTGKDVLARYVHFNSTRRNGEYVAVNCAGVSESLLESELFGHVKGSFTGAYRDKIGKLQLAHRGTLFLDEVGEMSLRMQATLLRFLENGEIQAVGADQARAAVDVRVIAATNRNLPEAVAAGHFREDLLYRLRVIHLHVPPLRERKEEVRPLANAFIKKFGRDVEFTDEAWQALQRYRWPGNIRELQNVIEQMVWMAQPGTPAGIGVVPQAVRLSTQALLPARERRRQVADDLYKALVTGEHSFWDHIYPIFLSRDITRHDIRELVRRGLSVTRGSYRGLLELFKMPPEDYKRFMNFLTTHKCRADFREFRSPSAEVSSAPRVVRAPLPQLERDEVVPHEPPATKAAS
jgi:transcriptional regulator with PAS, ATPase and Fis domain